MARRRPSFDVLLMRLPKFASSVPLFGLRRISSSREQQRNRSTRTVASRICRRPFPFHRCASFPLGRYVVLKITNTTIYAHSFPVISFHLTSVPLIEKCSLRSSVFYVQMAPCFGIQNQNRLLFVWQRNGRKKNYRPYTRITGR